jgi:hypothetical protein
MKDHHLGDLAILEYLAKPSEKIGPKSKPIDMARPFQMKCMQIQACNACSMNLAATKTVVRMRQLWPILPHRRNGASAANLWQGGSFFGKICIADAMFAPLLRAETFHIGG